MSIRRVKNDDAGSRAGTFQEIVGDILESRHSAYQAGRLEDLEESLSRTRQLLLGMDVDRFHYLNIMGHMLCSHFKALHKTDDIEQSVAYFREAAALVPTLEEARRPACAQMARGGLAVAHSARFRAFARLEDLQVSVALYKLAVNLGPQSNGNYALSLVGLASALIKRFEHLGDENDLASIVGLLSLEETAKERMALTLQLAASRLRRFRRKGNIAELEKAIVLYRAVIDALPHDDLAMVLAMDNLALALHDRYKRLNEMPDLSSSISLHKKTLQLLPEKSPERPAVLLNLGHALMSRIMDREDPPEPDLKQSLEDALVMRDPEGLLESFTHAGDIEQLDNVIIHYREAISLLPQRHDHLSAAFRNLAILLAIKFDFLGLRRDVDEALEFSRKSLELTPMEHPDRLSAASALANIRLLRYRSFAHVFDLAEALTYHGEALRLCPEGDPRCVWLYDDLVDAIWYRYIHSHQAADLETVLRYCTLALSYRPEGDSDRAPALTGLTMAYSARFKVSGRIEDVEAAIKWDREGLALHVPGHRSRWAYLNVLAIDLCTRFDTLSNMADLEDPIEYLTEAKKTMRETLPPQSWLDRSLAGAYLRQHTVYSSAGLLAKAFRHFESAFYHPAAIPGAAVMTLVDWAQAARQHGARVPLDAYFRGLALEQAAGAPAIDWQQRVIASPGSPRSLALDAAAAAIEEGQLEVAVELLEQGRATLWARLRGYRSSFQKLHDADDVLATQFENVTKQLEVLATSATGKFPTRSERVLDYERKMKAQRVLQEEWDGLVLAIRKLDGFTHFLQPASFAALRTAAEGGPIIVINASEYRCDALILRHAGPPALVPLSPLTLEDLRELNAQFLRARAKASTKQLVQVLRKLWKNVVQPVVAKLQELNVPRNTRVWWCPTSFLCGLPLHAAGMYMKDAPDANLPNLFISSYTQTLSALIQARANVQREAPVRVLVIGQSAEDLPAVRDEIAQVKALGSSVTALVGAATTKARVLSALHQHSHIHFACHATQHAAPFDSAFTLHGGEGLRLLDIAQARLPRAEFAFLAACETAAGDAATPDEAVHLAAALQAAGFRSVVGTLGEMADADGPFVAREFYGRMFRKGADAATALHGAVRALRKEEPQNVDRWINFIHVGA
ncbi:CHAT domain-containing protein [Mycena vulgaris]|nr:CHAT domain-containing protein [Mycena vulgaris]